MEYEVWTDGSCIKDDDRDSEGECGAGYLIIEKSSGKILHLHGEYIGITTNNMAEFVAVELALEDLVARNLGPSVHITIISDSKMVVEGLLENYNIRVPKLKKMIGKIRKLEDKLNGVPQYQWVKAHVGTELNEMADWLAYTAARG
jgi:ribonuclease HI